MSYEPSQLSPYLMTVESLRTRKVSDRGLGCMRRWLATGDTTAVSLSIVTYIPGKPMYAATVTPKTALLSDCADSWCLTPTDGWQAMTGEPLIVDPAPGYMVLPRSLERSRSRAARRRSSGNTGVVRSSSGRWRPSGGMTRDVLCHRTLPACQGSLTDQRSRAPPPRFSADIIGAQPAWGRGLVAKLSVGWMDQPGWQSVGRTLCTASSLFRHSQLVLRSPVQMVR